MTKDISQWDKAARVARSTEMNPNNPQFYDGRHMEPDAQRGDGILALPNLCRAHFGSEEFCSVHNPENFKKWENVAYISKGQDWVRIPDPGDYENYNYIMFCQKCGEINSRNFNWSAFPLNLSDSAYQAVLNKLAAKVGMRLWDDNISSEAVP